MPFVHLANGDVLDLSDKEWQAAQEESGTPNAFHKDGHGSHVIGVFPSDYDYEQTEEDVSEQEDRAAFEEWKRNKNAAPAAIEPQDDIPVRDDERVEV